jgi:hypothetical protein
MTIHIWAVSSVQYEISSLFYMYYQAISSHRFGFQTEMDLYDLQTYP